MELHELRNDTCFLSVISRNFTDYATIPSSASGRLWNFTDCAIMFPFDSRHVAELHELLNDGCQVPRSGQAKVACHKKMVPGRNWVMTPLILIKIGTLLKTCKSTCIKTWSMLVSHVIHFLCSFFKRYTAITFMSSSIYATTSNLQNN